MNQNMTIPKAPELLAPAGSLEGFEAALRAGADAFYAGGSLFGARAYAKNFGEEELRAAIRRAHLFDRKFYLTVNTLLKNRELEDKLYDYLLPFYEEGLDAVLVQDFGVLQLIRERFPALPVHASTQMTVTGEAGARFLQEMGLTRIVPARELSLEELRVIHKACPDLEIETFVHGALCYSYSGQCLMSSLIGGRSGNRGRCAQPCRLPWGLEQQGNKSTSSQDRRERQGKNQKSGFSKGKNGRRPAQGLENSKETTLLSMKDLNTLTLLPEILEAGVCSLKIEGRMKQPEYAAGVTQVYRKYLDLYLTKGAESYRVEPRDMERLNRLFSRGGSCEGYYKTYHGPGMISFSNDKKVGDEITVSLPEARREMEGELLLEAGKPAVLKLCSGEESITCVSKQEVQSAQERPLEEERVRRQMEKLGGTPFVFRSLSVAMEESVFLPMGVFNELRRQAVAALEEKLSMRGQRKMPEAMDQPRRSPEDWLIQTSADLEPAASVLASDFEKSQNEERSLPEGLSLPLLASCEEEETTRRLLEREEISGLYLPLPLAKKYLEKGKQAGTSIFLMFPHISRNQPPTSFFDRAEALLERGLAGFLVRDLESLARLRERNLLSYVTLDAPVYTWNDRAIRFWEEQGVKRNTLPLELNEGEIRHRDNRHSELLIYGYLPMMTSAQCIRKSTMGCNGKEEVVTIEDRYSHPFRAKCYCLPWKPENTRREHSCYNVIYNRLPMGLPMSEEEFASLGIESLRLSFTLETAREAMRVVDAFGAALSGKAAVSLPELTRGHFKRGVE